MRPVRVVVLSGFITKARPVASRKRIMNGNVCAVAKREIRDERLPLTLRRRFRLPTLSIIQTAGTANAKLRAPKPRDAYSASDGV